MAAPTLVAHGTDSQCARHLRPLFVGDEIWCQLFSEPGAGSDVAGLATSARRDGDTWLVNGQKVWTSLGHLARWGPAPRPDRSRGAQAPGPDLLRGGHGRLPRSRYGHCFR